MTTAPIVFKLGAVDGESEIEPLTEWLAAHTERGSAVIADFPLTMMERGRTNYRLFPKRVFFLVTVHSEDEAFWTRMRWAEDIAVYERTKSIRDAEDAKIRALIEQQNPMRFYEPSIIGPASYSMGAKQSKMIVPYKPDAAAKITETAKHILQTYAQKVVHIEDKQDFLRVFGGRTDDELSYRGMKVFLQHGLGRDDDPEK